MVLIPIPVSTSYTATAHGRTCKIVTCEHCQQNYFYEMERSASGGSSGTRTGAMIGAQIVLQNTLATEFDIVPCPHCGSYQGYMASAVRGRHLMWMLKLGIVMTLIGLVFLAGFLLMYFSASHTEEVVLRMRVCLLIALAVGLPGIGIVVAKCVLTSRYDHNGPAELPYRLKVARAKCISREHFESLMEDAIDEAIKKAKADELPEFLRRKK